jgi:hypothetical protein
VGRLVDTPQPCQPIVEQCGGSDYSESFTDAPVEFRDQNDTLLRVSNLKTLLPKGRPFILRRVTGHLKTTCLVGTLAWKDEPFYHCRETCLIFGANSLEFETQSTPSLDVPDRGIGRDLSVLYKKMKFNRRVGRAYLQSFDKQTTHTQISNSRRIFIPAASPDDPHALRRFNSPVFPS